VDRIGHDLKGQYARAVPRYLLLMACAGIIAVSGVLDRRRGDLGHHDSGCGLRQRGRRTAAGTSTLIAQRLVGRTRR